ncbi:cutinase transcription factor 1 beta [Fusarium subglutinans]|uniref:Cutinase transcription factor 1 beta n=1 Tax=Gibberella subglutinans TaxID=42677 RepID=A0A8H5P2M9_GIBSU|nr:cutinase transcription factor 1 beta [Fusarium subglutinans]KAF5587797.1 cutinase transcription factor 1 beta [Fusarium subglutinans]
MTPSLRPNEPPTPRSIEESTTTTSEPRNILPATQRPSPPLAPTTIAQHPPNFAAGSPTHPDYAFLQVPDTKDLFPQDLAFLVSQGCFVVPQRAALDDFLRQYFLHVHPMLPILNEKDFWLSYNSVDNDVEYEMPMLVLQGILFISSGFVSSETIKMLGFEDVHQAKLAFYRRSKLLYDFSVEKSCIAIAQASLLLAHTHLIPRCIAGNKPLGSIWLGIAISYARVAKAHCYSSLRPNKDTEVAKVQKLRNTLKRLWCSWSETKTTLDERMAEDISPASSIILFKNLIEMYYHSARLSVCHYNILRSNLLPPSQSDTQLRRQSEDLQGSASRVTECLLEFDRLGLSRWLPMTAIGCTAFPLALQMIDVELLRPKKPASPEEGVKLTQKEQHVENILKQMKSYKKKYYITDWVMRAIRHVVELARQRSPAPMSTEDDSSPSSCLDMLKTRPSYYLRLVMTLDMSISNGRLPDECDFPPSLRKAGRGLSSRSQATSMPTVDEQSMKRFSAMNKHLIPDNLTDHSNFISNNMQAQDLRTIDQEAFFNNKQPFPADLTAALCEITNIPPLDFSDMSLMDSTHFNDFGGVPFWPYDLLGSPPDQAGTQVEEVGLGDMFTGLMGDMNDKTYDGNGKESAANDMIMDSF